MQIGKNRTSQLMYKNHNLNYDVCTVYRNYCGKSSIDAEFRRLLSVLVCFFRHIPVVIDVLYVIIVIKDIKQFLHFLGSFFVLYFGIG